MRRLSTVMLIGCVGLVLALAIPAGATHEGCPHDSVRVGTTCLDKYEASLWRIAPPYTMNDNIAIAHIRAGSVTLAHLRAAGAKQLGFRDDLEENGCRKSGNACKDVYAVSIATVAPAVFVTWFQATAAARNSWKRLPTNAEWQAGTLGTPDPLDPEGEDCNTTTGERDVTGNRANCVSDAGAFDMVGNVNEWVADWVPLATLNCRTWELVGINDTACVDGAAASGVPGALVRGGSFRGGAIGGAFAVTGNVTPDSALDNVGFRAAR